MRFHLDYSPRDGSNVTNRSVSVPLNDLFYGDRVLLVVMHREDITDITGGLANWTQIGARQTVPGYQQYLSVYTRIWDGSTRTFKVTQSASARMDISFVCGPFSENVHFTPYDGGVSYGTQYQSTPPEFTPPTTSAWFPLHVHSVVSSPSGDYRFVWDTLGGIAAPATEPDTNWNGNTRQTISMFSEMAAGATFPSGPRIRVNQDPIPAPGAGYEYTYQGAWFALQPAASDPDLTVRKVQTFSLPTGLSGITVPKVQAFTFPLPTQSLRMENVNQYAVAGRPGYGLTMGDVNQYAVTGYPPASGRIYSYDIGHYAVTGPDVSCDISVEGDPTYSKWRLGTTLPFIKPEKGLASVTVPEPGTYCFYKMEPDGTVATENFTTTERNEKVSLDISKMSMGAVLKGRSNPTVIKIVQRAMQHRQVDSGSVIY